MSNVLILSLDDLTYWVGQKTIYSDQVHAPNIQRLADMGVNFTNAYTAEALCNPSRTSFWSGKTPNITGVHANEQAWQEHVAPADMLTSQFLRAGYDVGGYGKLLHNLALPADITRQMYSEYAPVTGFQGDSTVGSLPNGVREADLADHKTIDSAIAFLQNHDESSPFMLNVGLVKPHLNWVVPQEYLDLYPLDTIEVPGLVGDDMSGVPAFIRDQLVDSRGHPVPNSVAQAKVFMQGYLASISYADSQIGRLFAQLDADGTFNSTTIVLWSDHGYHLGDRDNLWGKFTLWEEATKVPFIVKLPGNAQAGHEVNDVVNLVDAFPTLMELAGLDTPAGLSGDSLVPLLYGSGPANGDGMSLTWMYGNVMLRTPGYALIRYEDGSLELYDMVADPDQIHNLAADAAHAATRARLQATLIDKADIVLGQNGLAVGGAAGEMFYLNTAETAWGGQGDDRYYVNHAGGVVVEQAGQGRDIVYTSVNYTLPANIEDLVVSRYTGKGVTMLTANDQSNTVIAGTGSEVVRAGAGNDTVRGNGGNDTLLGEAGDDRLQGWISADLIFGGDGNDQIQGLGGNDTLYGGDGNDILITQVGMAVLDGGAGADQLYGTAGANATAAYWSAQTVVTASLSRSSINTGDARGDSYSNILHLAGSGFADRLEGTSTGGNLLAGGVGDDTLQGLGGDDTLRGGLGADQLEGGDGSLDWADYRDSAALRADLLLPGTNTGEAAGDSYFGIEGLLGGGGNDTLLGSTGNEALEGGSGNDELWGRAGNDTLRGGAGDDALFGGIGSDRFEGGAGFDSVQYVVTNGLRVDLLLPGTNTGEAAGDSYFDIEALLGGSGNDTLLGHYGNEVIDGLVGNDEIWGRAGNDTLLGGAGDDVLFGGDGADRFEGGAGFDSVQYVVTSGLRVDLLLPGTNTGEAAGDTYFDIEALLGGSGNDTLLGHYGNEVIDGLAGNDAIWGRAGNDTLRGGAGDDALFGGDGADRFEGGAGFDSVQYVVTSGLRVDLLLPGTNTGEAAGDSYLDIEALLGGSGDDTLLGHYGNEVIDGLVGNDALWGRAGNDTLRGGAGDDVLFGGDGADRFEGGAGFDSVQYVVTGGLRVDLLLPGTNTGEAAGDSYLDIEALLGGSGNDTLLGNTGNERVEGLAGNDALWGRAGNDTLLGGLGNDRLSGGTGADLFVFQAGVDRIADLGLAEADRIMIDRSLIQGQNLTGAEIVSRFAQVSNGMVVLNFGGENRLVLENITDLTGLADHLFSL